MTKKIRILIADDHGLVREGLKQLFALTSDIVTAHEATNGSQVLEALEHENFDLLLLDMSMPGISGAELIARIVSRPAPPPILVLSMHNEAQIARRALIAGATGYLTKDNNPEVLLGAIRKLANGGRFLDAALAEAMAFESTAPARPRRPDEILSEREYQVFLLLAKGSAINDIAAQLSISSKTISTHKARLMEKMGFANSADLVRYAISHGLLD
ncbi:MAG: response regulator transcription factor [Azonexus sp.]